MVSVLVLLVKVTILLAISTFAAWTLRRSPARLRHKVWVCALAGCIALPLLASTLNRLPWHRPSPPRGITVDVRNLPAWLVAGTTSESSSHAARHKPQRSSTILVVLLFVWVMGTCFSLGRLAQVHVNAAGIRRRARPLVVSIQQHGASTNVLESDEVSGPAVVGLRTQFILLPAAARQWTEPEVLMALAHERAHIRRRDTWTRLLADFASSVYWFHPLMHFAVRQAALESECACDEAVVAGGIEATEYSALLLKAARSTTEPAAPTYLVGRSELRTRLLSLLDSRRSAPRWVTVITLGALLSFTAVLSVLTVTATEQPQVSAKQPYAAPNTSGDPFLEPESEYLPIDPALPLPREQVLRDLQDRELYRVLLPLTARIPRAREDYVAARARWALAQARDGQLIVPLVEKLSDPDWRVRAYASFSLGVGRRSEGTLQMVRNMSHPVWRMRAMSAFALAQTHDPALLEVMIRGLKDEAWQVRAAAVEYFGPFPQQRALVLRATEDEHVVVQSAAARTLERMSNEY